MKGDTLIEITYRKHLFLKGFKQQCKTEKIYKNDTLIIRREKWCALGRVSPNTRQIISRKNTHYIDGKLFYKEKGWSSLLYSDSYFRYKQVEIKNGKRIKQKENGNLEKIHEEGNFKGIVPGKSNKEAIVKTFGDKFTEVKRSVSVLPRGGESYSYTIERMNYKNKGLEFRFICSADSCTPLNSILFCKPFKGKTEKGIIIGKSTMKDVLSIYGDGYFNNGGFLVPPNTLRISYDNRITFITDKAITESDLEDLQVNDYLHLKITAIEIKGNSN